MLRSADRPVSRVEQAKLPPPAPKLNATMPCDTAFRVIAQRHLEGLKASYERTCNGDRAALHQMRIALTHLRAAILFFSPMLDDAIRDQVRDDLKWLNGELGALRDLDVAIASIKAETTRQPQAVKQPPTVADLQSWHRKRTEGQRQLSRALRSAQCRRLISHTSSWIENGPWSTKRDKQSVKRRTCPIGVYGAEKLAEWEEELLAKSRKLRDMKPRKRHRLRLLNKKLNYSIESVSELFEDKRLSKQRAAMKHLRKAQRSLGQLNDANRGRALALALRREGVKTSPQFLSAKREKRLLRTTETAYRELAALKPWKVG
jgi:CHAD domain-containing protein